MIIGDEHGELLAKHDEERRTTRNLLILAGIACGALSFLFNMYYIGAPYELALAYAIGIVLLAFVIGMIAAFFDERRLYSFLGAWILLTLIQLFVPSWFEPRDRLADLPEGAKTAVEEKLRAAHKQFKPLSYKAYLYPSSRYVVFAEYYFDYNEELDYGSRRTEPHIAFKGADGWQVLDATIENQEKYDIDLRNTPFCADSEENEFKHTFCD